MLQCRPVVRFEQVIENLAALRFGIINEQPGGCAGADRADAFEGATRLLGIKGDIHGRRIRRQPETEQDQLEWTCTSHWWDWIALVIMLRLPANPPRGRDLGHVRARFAAACGRGRFGPIQGAPALAGTALWFPDETGDRRRTAAWWEARWQSSRSWLRPSGA